MTLSTSNLPLSGLQLIRFDPFEDLRGSFTRVFCSDKFRSIWLGPIQQINHSVTSPRGAIRGLHFQHPPHAEQKLVICLKGEVWDVAVDLRADSFTFLKWHATVLNESSKSALLIPEGFAHGFQVCSDQAELLYFHSHKYVPEAEGGVHPFDPRLGILWPQKYSSLSKKDSSLAYLTKTFSGLVI